MELLLLVFFCLLTGSEVTFGAGTTVTVDDGSNVILPCSLREDITNKKFVWKKDDRQVFLYDDGDHSNIVNTGQDQQFIGRVEHFLDELKSGDASITISNTKVTDSGEYTCEFPDLQPSQIFYVKLIVYVEAPQPSVRILNQIDKIAVLQCEVRGAFPKPELHWEDRAGNKLPADEPQESERGGLFYIILQTTVYMTNHYRCVVTQKEINHQTHDETYVSVPVLTPGEIAAAVLVPLLVFALAVVGRAVYRRRVRIKKSLRNGAAKPYVEIFTLTEIRAVLQCEVRGAFPKPELHWEDEARNKLEADELQESERGGLFYISLKTTVYKAGYYRCVAEQKETNHQADAYILVYIPEKTLITVEEGRDVILPCSLNTTDITDKKFVWKKDGRQVFLYDKGTFNNNSQTQHQQFRERVEPFPSERKSCDASIIIRNTKVADNGVYTCEFPDLQPSQIFRTQLVVFGKTVTVEEGRDVILPCSLREDITNKKFEWKKDDQQVFLYDAGDHSNNIITGQDQQFKGRVEHFRDKLKSGDASITIRDIKEDDGGEYTFKFPKQIFHVQLIVAAPNPCDDEAAGLLTEKTAPTAVTAPGNGSAQDPKKTDGRDVEAGVPLMAFNKNQPPNEDSRF